MNTINSEWAPNQADQEPTDQNMRQAAMAKGYTQEVWAEGGDYSLPLLIKPDADLDGTFRAFDLDECEWINVNGWNFTIKHA